MINNILDNYFLNKLNKCLYNWILPYALDILSVKNGDEVEIYIKHKKFNDSNYKRILKIRKEDAILYLCNLIETKNNFVKLINSYIREIV